MSRKLAIGVVLCLSATASADDLADLSAASFDPSNAVAPISTVEGPGIKVGEGTVLHPVVGVETGFVSNVFYEEEPKAAGLLRLLAQIGTASLSQQRLNPNAPGTEEDDVGGEVNKGSLQYYANLRLAYDQPLSGDDTVQETGGLGIGARFRGLVNPMQTWQFGFDEGFTRTIRAANFETTSNENRDINVLRLMLIYRPRGRAISGYLYYQNSIDIFEGSSDLYPDRMDNRVGFHPTWQILPKTQLFADVSIGMVQAIGSDGGSDRKVDSYPLIARAGIATLLSVKTSVNLSGGYTNGFYSAGPSFSRPYFDAGIAYRYSPLGRVGLGYGYLHFDSVNANYYRDHVIRGYVQQLFVPFAVVIQPEVHFRSYNGVNIMGAPPTRDDFIFQVIAGAHYNFRNWIAATLDYKFSTVQTDFTYMEATGQTVELDYLRHELMLGMRVAM